MRPVRSSPLFWTTRRVAHEAQGVSGDPQAELDLRADRHPLDERAQGLGEKGVALVAPVVAYCLPQKTRRDPQPDLFGLAFAHAAR
jgi:hypothetical protein